jgi:hypothetical protein
MSNHTLAHAQADMRSGYYDGAPGVLMSGLVWLVSGIVAIFVSPGSAVLALLFGGALIHPLSVLAAKVLGRSGAHGKGNPLGRLAIEGTVWFLAGIAIAYALQVLRLEWFFPAMLLLIGGRYLTFQSLYGLRIYWIIGATLCIAGLALGLARASVPVSALVGSAMELIFATLVFNGARNRRAAQAVAQHERNA